MRFSIIIVCLNPGEKLQQTVDSVLEQSYQDLEVIVKDGGSRDGSVDALRERLAAAKEERVRIFAERDGGIYDAMNQAVAHAKGEFLIFMNCGDVFFEAAVLEQIKRYMQAEDGRPDNLILYGNTYSGKYKTVIASPPKITGFTCYRNIPCHQSCVYAARLCREKPYDLQYKIRADYDHFLWCYYVAGAKIAAMDLTVAAYEGGGFSESRENRRRDQLEHRRITGAYMSRAQILWYRVLLLCTLAPLRRFLAESAAFSDAYHKIKEKLYHKGKGGK